MARDAESSYLELNPDAGGALDDLIGHSITYRVAVGPLAGQKGVFVTERAGASGGAKKRGGAVRGVLIRLLVLGLMFKIPIRHPLPAIRYPLPAIRIPGTLL